MGKILRFSTKVIIRLGVEEVLEVRAAAAANVAFTIAEYVRWFAMLKAQEKKVVLPGGACTTTFDKKTAEFVVTFADQPEQAL